MGCTWTVIYGTLLAVCASNTKLEEAESYFNWMKDEGHSPNVFHYSYLLNAYSISGNYRKAHELVQDMKSARRLLGFSLPPMYGAEVE
ncbi:hypothetical protein SO802_029440 [Lithocarpus litseifolius]|uniref:Pentatricopeptide repeat-containing protein n=1 Tax=Lithocarpus litseifolius TaxID=425828 RepID=A0AAW2BV58_9ROSI